MKFNLTVDLGAYREEAKSIIDQGFANSYNAQRVEAHRRKREEAREVVSGAATETPLLSAEAARVGVDLVVLAQQILDRPDEFCEQENQRRILIERIRAANTKSEVDEIVAESRGRRK